MVQQSFEVMGMTCQHCENAVVAELNQLYGVSHVQVTLNPTGTSLVSITSDDPLNPQDVTTAIMEAGYESQPKS